MQRFSLIAWLMSWIVLGSIFRFLSLTNKYGTGLRHGNVARING
jgi:hypothetical protein